jgi:hypothetical protein
MSTLTKTLAYAGMFAVIAFNSVAFAGAETPRIDQRQENQERRIDQGIESGNLTGGEVRKLDAQQNRIQHAEAMAKADGVVTRGERLRLTHRQNKASRNIYRKKHNLQR